MLDANHKKGPFSNPYLEKFNQSYYK